MPMAILPLTYARRLALARLLHDLCPAHAAASEEGLREIPNMSTQELLRAEAVLSIMETMTPEELSAHLGTLPPEDADIALAEIATLEIKLMTGEVDCWIAMHSDSGVTRAEVEQHLAFQRSRLPPSHSNRRNKAVDAYLRFSKTRERHPRAPSCAT
jgi:hypothetical protein